MLDSQTPEGHWCKQVEDDFAIPSTNTVVMGKRVKVVTELVG